MDEYELETIKICGKVYDHVHHCSKCKNLLSFDPVEKSLLKTHSIKNEIFELLIFIIFGVIVIFMMYILKTI